MWLLLPFWFHFSFQECALDVKNGNCKLKLNPIQYKFSLDSNLTHQLNCDHDQDLISFLIFITKGYLHFFYPFFCSSSSLQPLHNSKHLALCIFFLFRYAWKVLKNNYNKNAFVLQDNEAWQWSNPGSSYILNFSFFVWTRFF